MLLPRRVGLNEEIRGPERGFSGVQNKSFAEEIVSAHCDVAAEELKRSKCDVT